MKISGGSKAQISFDFAGRTRAAKGHQTLTERQKKMRLGMLSGVCICWSLLLVARLYSLQISDFETWQDWALKQHFSQISVSSERGPILDRNGKLMAVSVPAGSIYARPRQVRDHKAAAVEIAKALDMKQSEVAAKLREDRPFVWIQRQVPRATAEKVAEMKIPGVNYVMESKRLYPFSEAASSLIGKAGIDGNGLSGIELTYDKKLKGQSYEAKVRRDALGNIIDISSGKDFELPKGDSVQLTIDAAIQVIMDEETEAGRKTAQAKRAMAVMIDSETGEILGMSQAPSINFNAGTQKGGVSLGNLAVETVFEPGSIMKPLVVAAAIDEGFVQPHELVDCEGGRYSIFGKTIKDVHPNGVISVEDIVIRSSNIGMTKIGLRMGKEKLFHALTDYGFGSSPKLGLSGETPGLLRKPDRWAMIDIATHAFGQGVAVTPLQVARATAAIANGGKLPKLTVIQSGESFESHRILSEKTATVVREMMYGVVEDEHGTGQKADIDGVRVGGKTGTAQKARVGGRGYEAGKYIAGFVGFVDAAPLGIEKNITMMVAVDEPSAGTIYGGTVSAPIFKRIMQRTLHYLATSEHLVKRPPESLQPVALHRSA